MADQLPYYFVPFAITVTTPVFPLTRPVSFPKNTNYINSEFRGVSVIKKHIRLWLSMEIDKYTWSKDMIKYLKKSVFNAIKTSGSSL